MEGSQWHRYPSSSFFNLWVEAKLSNPDSIILPEPHQIDADKPKFSEVNSIVNLFNLSPERGQRARRLFVEVQTTSRLLVRSKRLSLLRELPQQLQARFRILRISHLLDGCKTLQIHNRSLIQVESFKDHPTLNSASKIYTKHFGNPDNKDEQSALIQVSKPVFSSHSFSYPK